MSVQRKKQTYVLLVALFRGNRCLSTGLGINKRRYIDTVGYYPAVMD